MTGLSISAYARHRGVSHVAVHKALKAGRIQKEPDGTIDPVKADIAWAGNSLGQAPEKAPATVEVSGDLPPKQTGQAPTLTESRALREAYNAQLAKLAYEERSGQLIKTEIVKAAWFEVLRVLRDRNLNLPDRMAPILSAETDQNTVRDLLEAELRQILDDAAAAVEAIKIG